VGPSHDRERSLTVLVIVEGIELFLIAPLSVTNHVPFAAVASIIAVNVVAVLAVVWHIRAAVTAVVGQLFPATLLARLITLELEHRRDAS
jgi:hypothetical protein